MPENTIMPENDIRIHVSALDKQYGNVTVIENLNLDIKKGEFVSLLGPSGSGKTTLLMILAGFEKPTAGSVSLDGTRIENLPPHKRGLGVVFQNYALFPHMTVAENIAFPLKMRNVSAGEIETRVQKALDMVQLSQHGSRKPTQLSGGQQQRIALARAIVFEPRVVLMDEPFGALDKQLREQMQLDIREMHHRLGLTIVFVTHDQAEALTMSDRIAVFNKGQIEQIAPPLEIYERPRTDFVAQFIGETNLLKAKVISVEDKIALVEIQNKQFKVSGPKYIRPQQSISVSLRPESILLRDDDSKIEDKDNILTATITDTVYRGEHSRIDVDSEIGPLIVRVDRLNPSFVKGKKITAHFMSKNCWVIKP